MDDSFNLDGTLVLSAPPVGGRSLIVHLGPPKTATSSLQQTLANPKFADLGIGTFEVFQNAEPFGGSHHSVAALFGVAVPSGLLRPVSRISNLESARELILKELNESDFKVHVLSSEFLAEVNPQRLAEFFQFDGVDVKFCMGVRRPLEHAISCWSEMVRSGQASSLREFQKDPGTYLTRMQRWYGEFPRVLANLSFFGVPEADGLGSSLRGLFGGSGVEVLADPAVRQNRSLVPAATDVLASIAPALRSVAPPEWVTRYLIKELEDLSQDLDSSLPSVFDGLNAYLIAKAEEIGIVSDVLEIFEQLTALEGGAPIIDDSCFESSRNLVMSRLAHSQSRMNALAHLEIQRIKTESDKIKEAQSSSDAVGIRPWTVHANNGAIVTLVGHSHRFALEAAIERLPIRDQIRFAVVVGDPDSDPYWDKVGRTSGFLCVAWRGNEHNVLGIAPDFPFRVSTDSPDVSSGFNLPMVPRSQVRAAFARPLRHFREWIDSLEDPARVVVLGPPPPKPAVIIQQHLGNEEFFSSRWLEQGPDRTTPNHCPDPIRVALWKLQQREYLRVCEETGAVFVGAPQFAIDDQGFLKSDFSSADCTHANAEYGHLMLKEVLRTIGQRNLPRSK